MPTLLLELGCEELPASACREAQAQVPDLVRNQLGVEASHVYVTPRRIAFVVDELPETATEQLVKGPPAERRDQAAAGFAKRYGITEADLEERDGHLWARVPGEPLRGEPLLDRMRAIVHGLEFGKSMRWDASGHRFARPVRWFCEKLDGETLAGSGTTFGHRFTHGELDIESAQEYANTLRGANVEPDAAERRRLIVEALDALGEWRDPAWQARRGHVHGRVAARLRVGVRRAVPAPARARHHHRHAEPPAVLSAGRESVRGRRSRG